MPTQTTGAISLNDMYQSWGSGYTGIPSTNQAFNGLLRGGTYIPSIPFGNNQTTVPTVTTGMNFGNYYNVWQYKRLSFTMTAASVGYSIGKSGTGTSSGYSKAYGTTATTNAYNQNVATAFGSISASTFVTPRGTMNINGLMGDDMQFGSGVPGIVLGASTLPTDDDYSFIGIYNGFKAAMLTRSARSNSVTSGLSRIWFFGSALAWPTSGTYSCYVNYYG